MSVNWQSLYFSTLSQLLQPNAQLIVGVFYVNAMERTYVNFKEFYSSKIISPCFQDSCRRTRVSNSQINVRLKIFIDGNIRTWIIRVCVCDRALSEYNILLDLGLIYKTCPYNIFLKLNVLLHFRIKHYNDVIIDAIVYSIVYSDADQRKHQSSASVAFVRGIHRGSVNYPLVYDTQLFLFYSHHPGFVLAFLKVVSWDSTLFGNPKAIFFIHQFVCFNTA